MDLEHAARLMGMKAGREVLSVEDTPAGTVVKTHDGGTTLIASDGSMVHGYRQPVTVPEPKRAPIKVAATVGSKKTV